MPKFGFKNKRNRQLTIELEDKASSEKIFPLPPYSIRYKEMSTDEFNYVKARYGADVILRKVE